MTAMIFVVCLFLVFVTSSSAQAPAYDPLDYVDQLIGDSNGGNVFVGSTLPYGMAKAVADTNSNHNQGGFVQDGSNITGFSNMHDSGTGGSPSLGNFALFPYASCAGDAVDGCVFPKRSRATPYINQTLAARPGYFGLTLASGVAVDMTSAMHTNLFRFNFSGNVTTSPLILLDLTDLSDSRQDNSTISVDASTSRMTGGARFLPSFGSGNYVLYFCADWSGAPIRDNGIFVDARASVDVKDLKIPIGTTESPIPGGAFTRFRSSDNGSILARVGVSFISSAQACNNAETEIPDFDFAATRAAAETAWRTKLEPVSISTAGVDRSFLKNFYSGVYRTMVNPQNYTNENPLWSSSQPYFDSFYCLWDSFRSQLPFLTILDPISVTEMIRSLIDTQQHLGWLPDCRMSLCKGFTQGRSIQNSCCAEFDIF